MDNERFFFDLWQQRRFIIMSYIFINIYINLLFLMNKKGNIQMKC